MKEKEKEQEKKTRKGMEWKLDCLGFWSRGRYMPNDVLAKTETWLSYLINL